jgi:hypothetical protein
VLVDYLVHRFLELDVLLSWEPERLCDGVLDREDMFFVGKSGLVELLVFMERQWIAICK